MSAEIDVNAIAELLVEARQLLYRISCDLGPSLGKVGIIPTGAVADLVDLADRVHAEANSVHQHLRRVAQIKAEGNGGTLVSPTGLVGWRAVRPQGRWSTGGVVRMTDAELEAVSDEQG